MRALLVLMFVAGVSVGQDNAVRQETVVKSMLESMDKMTKVLKTMQDEDTSKAAVPELKKAGDAWAVLRKKAENTPPPTKEEKSAWPRNTRANWRTPRRSCSPRLPGCSWSPAVVKPWPILPRFWQRKD